ncbi:hypothetical protein [Streptomyces laurentii]|uniref:hypothetical protein n=1 Tax=Streptomyces laurentii TaxID=39478 RepID=UPI00340C3493
MKVKEVLELASPPSVEILHMLHEIGGLEGEESTLWEVPSGSGDLLVSDLADRFGIEAMVTFRLLPEQADSMGDLAAYLNLESLEEGDWFEPEDLAILRDPRDLSCVVSSALMESIEALCKGLTWTPCPEFGYAHRLSGVPNFPEPLMVPRPVSMMQGETGMWLVQSDGIEVLSPGNVKFLRVAGIADSAKCVAAGREVRRLRIPVFSGRVIKLLENGEIQGMAGPPIYLLLNLFHPE